MILRPKQKSKKLQKALLFGRRQDAEKRLRFFEEQPKKAGKQPLSPSPPGIQRVLDPRLRQDSRPELFLPMGYLGFSVDRSSCRVSCLVFCRASCKALNRASFRFFSSF